MGKGNAVGIRDGGYGDVLYWWMDGSMDGWIWILEFEDRSF